MEFEGKHRYFKKIVGNTWNFRNITLSLATKHQLMIVHHLQATTMYPCTSFYHCHILWNYLLKRHDSGLWLYSQTPSLCWSSADSNSQWQGPLCGQVFISWYDEHCQGFQLVSKELVVFVEQKNLTDVYPLSDYKVGLRHMVTLKRHIGLE